jgi:hypothetical protein
MSEAYERERQNNSRLDELASKVSALRGVTIDIYDSARQQDVIDSTVCSPPRAIGKHTYLKPQHISASSIFTLPFTLLHLLPFSSVNPLAQAVSMPSSPTLTRISLPPSTLHTSILKPPVRHILLLQHNPKGLRKPPRPHGAIREQSRHPQTLGDDHRCCDTTVLDLAPSHLGS